MRWLQNSLRAAIQRGPWSLEATARLLEQVSAALTVAHRDGVIHRDIKPDNILLDEDENAYLADFSIAIDVSNGSITEEDQKLSTFEYTAPEHIKQEAVTFLADVYSLGLIVYELLAGAKPYPDATTADTIIEKQLNADLPALHLQRSNLPVAIDEVLQTATAKIPSYRYSSAERFAAAFRAAIPNKQRASAQPLAQPLTERELDILRLIVSGQSNQEIAQKLYLSAGTVKWYVVQQIYRKLDVHSRRQAIERARQLDLIATGTQRPTPIQSGFQIKDEAAKETSTHVSELVNPYKGLRAFQEADAADFFGRAALTERLLAHLTESSDNAQFLAVVGPSGSGKSSVVRAGLIPALRQGALLNSARWFITEMLPGMYPLRELEAALLRVSIGPQPGLLSQLSEDRRGLVRATRRVLPSDQNVELLLLIDQFEELFTLVQDENIRKHFIDNLLSAVTDPRSRIRVVLTLRADFYDRPLGYPHLAELIRSHTEVVLPLTPDELERAIAGPAERVGLILEPGLVATIIRDVGEQPGTLPLLQYSLTELYESRDGSTLRRTAYLDNGGIAGALARRADALYETLDPSEQTAVRQLFLRLITLGEGTEDTRRRVTLAEFKADLSSERPLDNVINIFNQYRLLTFDRDPASREPTVEIAHESLLRDWGRLRDWLTDSREELYIHRRLMAASSEWRRTKYDSSYLATGARLAQFEVLAAEAIVTLNNAERSYLEASIADRQRHENERETQRRRLLLLQRGIIGVLSVFLLVAVGLSIVALNSRSEALYQAQIAFSRQLAVQAVSELDKELGYDEFAALLTIRSLKAQYNPVADGALVEAAARLPLRAFKGHMDEVRSVAFSPDGRYALTGSADRTARLWDIATGAQVNIFEGHTDEIWGVAFSPDGQYVLTGSADATAILWNASTGKQVQVFSGHSKAISSVKFSPDGKTILTISDDDTGKFWDVSSGRELRTFGTNLVSGAGAFSPDGKYLLTGGVEHTARLWDAETGNELLVLRGHTSTLMSVTFSPDGQYLLTGSLDNSAKLWDAATGQEIFTFSSHSSSVRGVAFSPDGKFALTGSSDRTIRLWDVTTGLEIQAFRGHSNRIWSVTFSPDGRYILSGSIDRTAKLWDISAPETTFTLARYDDTVLDVAYSPDGRFVITVTSEDTDNTAAHLIDLNTGQEVRDYQGHTNRIRSAVFSPDGRYLLTGSSDATAKLWDTVTGHEIRTFTGHTGSVYGLDFSADGRLIATASTDKTARLWNAATGQQLHIFDHAGEVVTIAFSPADASILTGSDDHKITEWDTVTGEKFRTFLGHDDTVYSITIAPDGKSMLTASGDTTAKLWDLSSGEVIRTFSGHTNSLYRAVFSPDGQSILTGSADRTARLWDVATGDLQRVFSGHHDAIWGVAFSPDGQSILTGSFDGTVRVWETDYHDLIAAVCSRLVRDFTDQEREQVPITDQEPTCA